MKSTRPVLLGLFFALACAAVAAAQDTPATPPKVIQIMREWIKPGKAGAMHDRSEAAFVSLMNKAKIQGHYLALNSISGKSRALYLTRYPSLEALEKDNQILGKNPSFAAELDRAVTADGDLLEGTDSAVLVYNEELSYHPHPDLSHARYYEVTAFHIKPGHIGDWMELVKAYKAACDKMNRGDHWAAYEVAYGGEAGTYITLTHRDSLAEIDKMLAGGDQAFIEAIGGPEGVRKFEELVRETLDSQHTELFAINPKQSYADEAWIKADPDFWKPKKAVPDTALAKPAAAKPAATTKPNGN
jgi:hypothetical protein